LFTEPRFYADKKKTDQAGVVCVKRHEGGKVIITIAFRGTEDLYDWSNKLNAFLVSASKFGIKGKVHSGFKKRYKEILPALEQALDKALNSITSKEFKNIHFELTDHSQGAALATIAGVDIYNRLKETGLKISGDRFVMMLISSPRLFDATAAAETEELIGVNRIFKFSMEGDIVPHLPFKRVQAITEIFGIPTDYKHVGSHFLLPQKYYSPINNHYIAYVKEGDINGLFTKVGKGGTDLDTNDISAPNKKRGQQKLKRLP